MEIKYLEQETKTKSRDEMGRQARVINGSRFKICKD